MWMVMLKAKLHHARVTEARLEYQGSLTLDPEWLDEAGMVPYEQVQVYNVENGERFTTYVIAGTRGRREVIVNGAAARRAAVGDRLIIAAYAWMTPEEARDHVPRILILGRENQISAETRPKKSPLSPLGSGDP